jgi:hypothetical protein
MDMAKHICENLKKLYPDSTFVAYDDAFTSYGNLTTICDMNSSRVSRFNNSNGESLSDDALKSLLHRVVFDSRATKPDLARATHIYDQITKMLPGRNKALFVINTDKSIAVYGSHKGMAEFKEPEFGSHVTVVLH